MHPQTRVCYTYQMNTAAKRTCSGRGSATNLNTQEEIHLKMTRFILHPIQCYARSKTVWCRIDDYSTYVE